MKNLTYLILITFSINMFGQPHMMFDDKALVENTFYATQRGVITNELENYFYSFTNDDTLYVLSYRANDEENWGEMKKDNNYYESRDLILYRYDKLNNVWIEASDIVQTDYRFASPLKDYGTHWSRSTHNYNMLQYISNGGVSLMLKNGCIFMILSNIYAIAENEYDNYYYGAIVLFIPKGNGTYNVSYFEPINRKTKNIELNGEYCDENPFTSDEEIEIIYYNGLTDKETLKFIIKNGEAILTKNVFNLIQTK